MATHLDTGKEGEKLAETYLADRGYKILHRNWRYGRYELDLVTTKNDMLRFVEVKFRSSSVFGNPEDAVTRKKIQSLLQAINQYLLLHPQHKDFRLDIIAIIKQPGADAAYYLIEDVCL